MSELDAFEGGLRVALDVAELRLRKAARVSERDRQRAERAEDALSAVAADIRRVLQAPSPHPLDQAPRPRELHALDRERLTSALRTIRTALDGRDGIVDYRETPAKAALRGPNDVARIADRAAEIAHDTERSEG